MPSLKARLEKLEAHKGSKAPRRVIVVSGSNPSREEVRSFLAPFGVHADGEEDFIIILRDLVAPEGKPVNEEIRPAPHLPLRFSQTPEWLRQHPAYEDWMSR